MLADAIAAERFRLTRDRVALFWGFLFVPLASLFFNVAGQLLRTLGRPPRIPAEIKFDITGRIASAITGGALLVAMLFMLVGAAAIFAGDYRWETWRLVTPRNSRINLLAGKFVVFAEWTAISLALLALVGVLSQVTSVLILGGRLAAPPTAGAFLSQFAGVFAISWLEALVAGSLAALIGVVTRSTMGAVIAGQAVLILQSMIGALTHETSWKSLAIPAYAANVLKTFVAAPAWARPETGPAVLGLALLLVWLLVLAGAAVLLFRRQDLTRE